jgi:hypothetical protein
MMGTYGRIDAPPPDLQPRPALLVRFGLIATELTHRRELLRCAIRRLMHRSNNALAATVIRSPAFEYHDLMLGFPYHHRHPTSLSPTTRRSNLLINSALCALAAFMAVIVCFKVLVFDPQTTVPPITAASAPIMTVGSNPTAPTLIAKIKAPPAAMAAFETRMNFLQLSITSASSSMWASICKTCSRRSPSSSM